MTQQRPHLVVVLGMHRSGTSATARSLQALGVDLGDNLLEPLKDDNEKGFWEDLDLSAINLALLKALGDDWDKLTPIPSEDLKRLATSELAVRARDVLKAKLGRTGLFGMKDPRLARLMPFWQTVFKGLGFEGLGGKVSYVIACRNPISVVRSLAKRNDFNAVKGYVLWLSYVVPSLMETEGLHRIVVDYDRLMEAPTRELARIAHHIGQPFSSESAEVKAYCSQFLEERLRHTRFTLDDIALDDMAPPLVSDMYRWLLALAADQPMPEPNGTIAEAAKWLNQSHALLTHMHSAEIMAKKRDAQGEQDRRDAALQAQALSAALAARDAKLTGMQTKATEDTQRITVLHAEAQAHEARFVALNATLTIRDTTLAAQDTTLAARDDEATRLRAEIADRERVIAELLQSTSWRFTKPLRIAARLLRQNGGTEPSPMGWQGDAPRSQALMPAEDDWWFHTSETPDVSIIIPVYHHLDDTLACLASIARHSGTEYTYEIIVADDGNDAPVAPALPQIPGLQAYVNEHNLGFLRNCNKAAAQARGRHLVFLNNDTLVENDWLAPLVRIADEFPQAGLIGCQLLNMDGTIQDAGWTISSDGWGIPLGRNQPADHGEFAHLREVDCVGGACFLVRKSLFDLVGGFDDALAPAFYEEFDLAFALREHGYKTLCQPQSRVRHLGSASYGSGARDRLSSINHTKFVAKWAHRITEQPSGTEADFLLRERHGKRLAILMIDDCLPQYDRHAGGLTIDQYLRQLCRMGWRVIFAPANGQASTPYAQRLRQLGVELVHDPDSLEQWLDRNGQHLSIIWCARPDITLPLLPVFSRTSSAKVVYYPHDLHYLREQRRYEIERDPVILVTAATVRTKELAIFGAVNRVLSPSREEARIIRQDAPGTDVVTLPPYLYPSTHPPVKSAEDFRGRTEIMFVGGFPHLPNVDSAIWLATEIMPLVWKEEPTARLLLIGYAPPRQVLALAGPRIEVTGAVPDLAPYFERARLSVAPLRYGAGVKGKVVAALDAGTPVVTTPIGAEGIDLVDGVSALIAQTAEGLAQHIIQLFRDPARCSALAKAAIQLVEEKYSEKTVEHALRQALSFSSQAAIPSTESKSASNPLDASQLPPNVDHRDLARRFCSQPWNNVEIYDGGGVYTCCPAWNRNQSIGNIFTNSLDAIWNGEQAQRFRQGILDGSFSQCDVSKCSLIVGNRLPYRDAQDDGSNTTNIRQIIADGMVRLEQGPRVVKLGYDSSCNLSCPSCRTEVIVANKEQQTRLDDIFENQISPLLKDAHILLLSSDGDPFASHHYRRVLKLTAERTPNLRIGLTSNGQLLDQKAWEDCRLEGRVVQVQISVDAASAPIYEIVRRPGRFDRLLKNLEFLASLRRQGRIGSLELSFVVQACNYGDMPDFVRLGHRLGADAVLFMLIDQWSRGMDASTYDQAKIWDSAHPDFLDFQQRLEDPIFATPIVRMNALSGIRSGWQPPVLEVTRTGEIHRKEKSVNSSPVRRGTRSIYTDFLAAFPHARTKAENLIKADLVLVQAPGWGVNTPPLATAMLTGIARTSGYTVLPIDLNLEFYTARPPEFTDAWEMEQSLWFWQTTTSVQAVMAALDDKIEAFLDVVIASGAPVVGFTVYASSLLVTMELARRLKARRSDLVIVLGGPHVSRDMAGHSAIQDQAVDAAAQGEGERTLIDILERVKAGRSLEDCPGLLLRMGDGTVVDTGDREQIRKLDELPPPDFSDYSFQAYRTPGRLPLMGSRGCPNRCIYCNEREYWKSFRFRSAESIFAEIQAQMKRYHSIDFVDFQDSLVNGKMRELERLADLIIESGLRVQWAGQAIIRKEMTVEILAKLKRSGCTCLAYGLETPSPTLMHSIGKFLSKGADIDALAEAHGRSGLDAVYNVMFGLPGETEEDAFSVLEFLRRNHKFRLVVNPSPSFCSFSPGTEGYDHPERFGMEMTKGALFWESTDGLNTYPVRLKRFEDFCRLVSELGIETTYPATHLLERNRTLGRYFEISGNPSRASYYYGAWLEEHPEDADIRQALTRLRVLLNEDHSRAITYVLPPCTDENWVNGIARDWATAFFVPFNQAAEREFQVGNAVRFANGDTRTIIAIRENQGSLIVTLEGEPLDGTQMECPTLITILSAASPPGMEAAQ